MPSPGRECPPLGRFLPCPDKSLSLPSLGRECPSLGWFPSILTCTFLGTLQFVSALWSIFLWFANLSPLSVHAESEFSLIYTVYQCFHLLFWNFSLYSTSLPRFTPKCCHYAFVLSCLYSWTSSLIFVYLLVMLQITL